MFYHPLRLVNFPASVLDTFLCCCITAVFCCLQMQEQLPALQCRLMTGTYPVSPYAMSSQPTCLRA
jgi:hypothetical protein